MACGTPVIAFDRGSMPELIDDGVTGMLVADVAGAVAAVERWRRSTAPRSGPSRSSGSASTAWSTSTSRCTSRRSPVPAAPEPFRLGVNYWPSETAMDWLAPLRPRRRPPRLRPDRRRRHGHRPHLPPMGGRAADAHDASTRPALAAVIDTADAAAEAGGRADRHAVHRPHERRELDPGVGHRGGRRRRPVPSRVGGAVQPRPAGAAELVRRRRRSATPRRAWPTASPPRSPGIPPCGRGTSATRTPTARSRPTRRPPSDGSSG